MQLRAISAVTLAVGDMARSVGFYRTAGFELLYGGPDRDFTSFRVGEGYLNLTRREGYEGRWWGRVIFYVADVDAAYRQVIEGGLAPDTSPQDAPWGERYFHLTDPDGHELSFAAPLERDA